MQANLQQLSAVAKQLMQSHTSNAWCRCCCSAATKEDMAAHHALFINTLKVTHSTRK
jgi:hypothetical protein